MSIHEAAARGDLAVIRQHLEAGTDIDLRSAEDNSTALHSAALFGHAAVSEFLIESGADVDAANNDGSTPLVVAALMGYPQIAKQLMDAGADATIENNAGATALSLAEMPMEQIAFVYDILEGAFEPMDLKIDRARVEAERPKVAAVIKSASEG